MLENGPGTDAKGVGSRSANKQGRPMMLKNVDLKYVSSWPLDVRRLPLSDKVIRNEASSSIIASSSGHPGPSCRVLCRERITTNHIPRP